MKWLGQTCAAGGGAMLGFGIVRQDGKALAVAALMLTFGFALVFAGAMLEERSK